MPLDEQVHVSIDAFNAKGDKLARRAPSHDVYQDLWVYAAAKKTLAEGAVLDVTRECRFEQPDFAVNAVLLDLEQGHLPAAHQRF